MELGHQRSGVLRPALRVRRGKRGGCEGASHSVWSQIELPFPMLHRNSGISLGTVEVPVAFVGLAYFVCLAHSFALLGGSVQSARGGAAWCWRLPLVASRVIPVLRSHGVRSAPWCIGCVVVHVVNLLLMAAIWVVCATSSGEPVANESARPISRATLTAREGWTVIIFALVLGAGLYVHRRELLVLRDETWHLEPYKDLVLSLQQDTEALVGSYLAKTRQRVPARQGNPIPRAAIGSSSSRTLNANLATATRRSSAIRSSKPSAGAWMYGSGTSRYAPTATSWSRRPSIRTHAGRPTPLKRLGSGGRRAFERVHELLFANRKRLGDKIYRDLAVQAGLDPVLFLRQMEDPVVRQTVHEDIELARQLGVHGTPTMFLDGRRIPFWCVTPAFWQAVARRPVPSDGASQSQNKRDLPPDVRLNPGLVGHEVSPGRVASNRFRPPRSGSPITPPPLIASESSRTGRPNPDFRSRTVNTTTHRVTAPRVAGTRPATGSTAGAGR